MKSKRKSFTFRTKSLAWLSLKNYKPLLSTRKSTRTVTIRSVSDQSAYKFASRLQTFLLKFCFRKIFDWQKSSWPVSEFSTGEMSLLFDFSDDSVLYAHGSFEKSWVDIRRSLDSLPEDTEDYMDQLDDVATLYYKRRLLHVQGLRAWREYLVQRAQNKLQQQVQGQDARKFILKRKIFRVWQKIDTYREIIHEFRKISLCERVLNGLKRVAY